MRWIPPRPEDRILDLLMESRRLLGGRVPGFVRQDRVWPNFDARKRLAWRIDNGVGNARVGEKIARHVTRRAPIALSTKLDRRAACGRIGLQRNRRAPLRFCERR